jgi:serine phosphatase RsbU (regulator of sigma subunit)
MSRSAGDDGRVAVIASAFGDPAPETVRRLMRHVLAHQADHLQDDASIIVLEWRTGDERRLQL